MTTWLLSCALILAAQVQDVQARTPRKFLLVAKSGPANIHRIDLSSSKISTIPIDGLKKPIAVDYDPVEGRVYWTDVEERTIRSAKDGGSNVRLLRQLGQKAAPHGLSLDSQSRLLIYTDLGEKVFGLITLYSKYNYHHIVIDSDIDVPRDIELDKDNGVMYWTDVGVTPKIERANYDGTDRKILVSGFELLDLPVALALDKHGGRLYWADAAAQLIGWTDLEGQSTGVLFRKPGSRFFGMDIYKNDLYVTDWRNNSPQAATTYIYRINTDGKTEKKLLTAFGRLNDIRFYGDETQTKESNACRINKGGCTYICIPTSPNSSKCLTPDDSPSITPPRKFMLVTTSTPNAIKRIDINTQDTFVIPVDRSQNRQNPMAVDYDPPNARIYWTDIKRGAIRSANLDGSDVMVVCQFNPGSRPYGMSVDSLSRLIFYTDAGHRLIGMVRMSTNNYLTVLDSDIDMPGDIELDKHNGVMYWTDAGVTPKIERANYDGTDRRILVSGSANLDMPHGLALDRVGQRLYWADGESRMIGWTDVNGRKVREILRTPSSSFFGMDISLNTLFVTDRITESKAEATYIRRISTDGKRQDQVITVEGRLNDIRIYSEDTEDKGPNGCGRNNGGCEEICVPTPDNNNKCLFTTLKDKTEL
ncbi:low-density lipoprotein receptor-related protein 5-like isoform X2 [Pomacea canaliculata]|nr:low-density lipoprotein receptor-related protein 5-like isoform X2 [Pomacea canaliculata]XP_025083703.1 low-density lipoprotein receptor-related protein 5-like isoform X2 [Pomacea canaliculata]